MTLFKKLALPTVFITAAMMSGVTFADSHSASSSDQRSEMADIQLLLDVIHKLRDAGNTIVIIEHNLDVIKTADWIIDLGPEGGDGGGEIIAEGTPEKVSQVAKSYTGNFIKELLRPTTMKKTA